jgi:hypothetical protein
VPVRAGEDDSQNGCRNSRADEITVSQTANLRVFSASSLLSIFVSSPSVLASSLSNF